jgi:transposase
MLHTSRTPAKHYLVARVLLMSDQSQGEPEATDRQIAEILSISRRTVIRIKQRFVQGSLEVAHTGSFPRERPERRCLDGKGEARLIHLACSQAPDGRQGWTLELLSDKMVQLGYVERISPETVRTALKKLSWSWTISIPTRPLHSTKCFRQSRPKPSSTVWKSTTPQACQLAQYCRDRAEWVGSVGPGSQHRYY